jgi:hypothetical protein
MQENHLSMEVGAQDAQCDVAVPRVITDLSPMCDYDDGFITNNPHYGQLKLFHSLLVIFNENKTIIHHVASSRTLKILYVGAAPGNNIAMFMAMLPTLDIEFVCYDPAPICTRLKAYRGNRSMGPKLVYKRRSFNNDEAIRFRQDCDIFISDVRRHVTDSMTEAEISESIEQDMLDQQEWAKTIEPRIVSVLKFPAPYWKEHFTYLLGRIFLQSYAGRNSAETRLHVHNTTQYHTYDPKALERAMAYQNQRVRGHRFATWCPRTPSATTCQCADCILFFEDYFMWRANYNVLNIDLCNLARIHGISLPRNFR